ncbi:uroporphyrinogen-III synthase [Salibacterium qingdaonense]|uniref:Uroporphyrinogen-III synthase n=1 Tax=Salibacterium qingdaonense TaxID=266892 RepID=A0A1I4K375_9BACI|nr:uroporphyrinogen-III synthase [Salibacterium qingdaonense]SFL73071.1 uroporphyrinogen-III synthase [Salibacterium qingdaonense]
MAEKLKGRKIMLAASRKTEEMTALIEKQGGEAVVCPLQGTTSPAEDEVKPVLQEVIEKKPDWFIFMTGMGTDSLFEFAEKAGEREALVISVKRANVAARGYKTTSALKQIQLVPDARDDDGTIDGLIRALEPMDFHGKTAAVQLHGIASPKLNAFLYDKGAAEIVELYPYKYSAPEEAVLEPALTSILAGSYDAVCFTTQMQVHSLFRYAKQQYKEKELAGMLMSTTAATAVGKVTAEALREEGVTRIVAPENERMGAMIMELGSFYS